MFDDTISSMSEEELNMAMGAAAMVGSVIGSILGSRAAGGGGAAAGRNALLSTTASLVGSALASRAAGSLVLAVHEDSKQRVLERREREEAMSRGGNGASREGTTASRMGRERVFRDAGKAFQKAAGEAVSGMGTGGGVASRRDGGEGGDCGGGRFSWAKAAELVLEGVRVCAEMQQQQGGGTSNSTRRHGNHR
jgi:hypothetical protein